MEINIDAANAIAGRVASYAAKQALLGNTIRIVNCEKAILSGSRRWHINRYNRLINVVGQPQYGPFISRMPDRLLRRIIRGMLPRKKARGRAALKRIRCFIGVPASFEGKQLTRVPGAEASKLKTTKVITLKELCNELGAGL
ncbi:MAG: 50S ribosomal protein L13 [Candidatus Woesearchaeota archaeon]